jgi:hypothetical protein
MKAMNAIIGAGLLAAAVITAPAIAGKDHAAHSGPSHGKATETQTAQALRDLWLGHVFWVRDVVQHTLSGNTAAAKAAEDQAVANAKAIAGAIEPFYGKPASEKLFGLLAGHYGAVKEYLEASKAGSKPKQDAATGKLVANANEIAAFLAGANPNLPEETLKGLLAAHGGHHLTQIQQLQSKQYAQEAATWEAMKNHMYVIADALAGGLAKQFPEKFS